MTTVRRNYSQDPEYLQLSQDILHCSDIGRAALIAERLAEIRTEAGVPPPPSYPHAQRTDAERTADRTGRYEGVALPASIGQALCSECREYHEKIYGWYYTWLCAKHWVERRQAS